MTLYEIDNAIMELIDEETGEITDIDALNALEMERERKITNVACAAKNAKALADALKNEKQEIEKRMKAAERTVASCKEYILNALGGVKMENERCKISYRHTTSVDVADNINFDNVPAEFIKVTKEIKKTEVKKAIEEGATIDGCRIVEKTSVQIK